MDSHLTVFNFVPCISIIHLSISLPTQIANAKQSYLCHHSSYTDVWRCNDWFPTPGKVGHCTCCTTAGWTKLVMLTLGFYRFVLKSPDLRQLLWISSLNTSVFWWEHCHSKIFLSSLERSEVICAPQETVLWLCILYLTFMFATRVENAKFLQFQDRGPVSGLSFSWRKNPKLILKYVLNIKWCN